MKLASSAICFTALSCISVCAFGQASAIPIESLRVFADRPAALRSDGTQAIAVITRRDIESRVPSTVPELLREVAGVHIDRVGGSGPSNVYIRGAEPNHTVVLIDGVRVNDPTDPRGGSFDLGAVALDEVERIEVLRGASSAQFGADAMGGVVNIVTRRRSRPAEGRLAAGSHGHRAASGRISFAPGLGDATFGISRLEEGREREGGESRRDTADMSWAYAPRDGSELRLHARGGRFEASGFPESSGGARLAISRELERREGHDALASASWRHHGPAWSWSIRAASTQREEDRDSPAVLPGPGGFVPAALSRTDLRTGSFSAMLAHAGAVFQPAIGVESRREDGTRESTLFLPDPLPTSFRLLRETRAAFGQVEAQPAPGLTLLAAVRHDDIDPGGSKTTRSAGARQRIAPEQWLRAHWSEGFKPASFYALADPLIGNASLRPETSRGIEAGWEMVRPGLRLQLTAFDNRTRDLVDFDPESFSMVNRANARAKGAEARASIQALPSIRLDASFTYADVRLEESEARLRNRPRHRGSIAAAWEQGAWIARAALVHVGRTFDFSVPTGTVTLPAYTTMDLVLRWRQAAFDLGVALDNVTDRGYESFVGFTDVGRRIRGFVSVRLP
jgi:outer membrane cobalamin receptor